MTDERSSSRVELSALQMVQGPRALRMFATLLVALLLVAFLSLFFVPWQQNVPGAGKVVAFDPFDRIQTVAAPVDGRVKQAWVIEGSRVKQGDPLLEIVDNDPSILRRLEEQRGALQSQLDAAREKVRLFRSQVEALQASQRLAMEAARNQVAVARAAVRSERHGFDAAKAVAEQARLNFERHRDLVGDGLVSDLEFEVTDRTYKETRARVEQSRQALSAAVHDEESKVAELGQVETENQARIESAKTSEQSAQVEAAALEERLTALAVRIAQQNTPAPDGAPGWNGVPPLRQSGRRAREGGRPGAPAHPGHRESRGRAVAGRQPHPPGLPGAPGETPVRGVACRPVLGLALRGGGHLRRTRRTGRSER